MTRVYMVIDGHDWRYIGDGHRWLDKSDPKWTGTWADLVRVPYSHKVCITCGTKVAPDAKVRPCHEIMRERTGYPYYVGQAA